MKTFDFVSSLSAESAFCWSFHESSLFQQWFYFEPDYTMNNLNSERHVLGQFIQSIIFFKNLIP